MRSVIAESETGIEFYAFLQPLRYKNKIYLTGVSTELGYDGMNKYLLLAPKEVDPSYLTDSKYTLCFGQDKFRTDHCEPVYFKGKVLYLWAVIHKEGR